VTPGGVDGPAELHAAPDGRRQAPIAYPLTFGLVKTG
jgi:hypothetical protein